ncbi:hypothetical protein WMF04_23865 [Sorangium sp. So ce260]|uniref:hypothetical protein n=1 Tax=Sorangium sp. So ce260 TaxID=3133291 RepID=UPI003F644422
MIEALDSVSVEQSDQCPNGFQLSFTAARTPSYYDDKQLLSSGLLGAGARVIITATLGGAPSVLMDGFVTHLQVQAATMSEEAKLIATGEDVSFQMGLYEYSLEYPLQGDAAIVAIVLAKWMALGIIPEIIPTPTSMLSFEDVPQQVGNDRDYLNYLAQQHGYVFYISPGPQSGLNTAYWGPPKTFAPPQPTLTVDAGSDTNVNDLSFDFDATKAQRVYGAVLDTTTNLEIPVVTITGTRVPPLARKPAILFDMPYVRTTLFQHQGLNVAQAYALAQSITNLSTDKVVTGKGSLDALRYGQVLKAAGVVGVRGVGATFDGYYYVQKVSHQISRDGWTQTFQLQREGLGSTVTRVGA